MSFLIVLISRISRSGIPGAIKRSHPGSNRGGQPFCSLVKRATSSLLTTGAAPLLQRTDDFGLRLQRIRKEQIADGRRHDPKRQTVRAARRKSFSNLLDRGEHGNSCRAAVLAIRSLDSGVNETGEIKINAV